MDPKHQKYQLIKQNIPLEHNLDFICVNKVSAMCEKQSPGPTAD